MPLTGNSNRANAPARWSVYYRKNGKWKRRKFGVEFDKALEFYVTVRDQLGTLHSDNVAFAPPPRLTEHETYTWKVVKVKGKRYKKKVLKLVNLLEDYNRKGVWWCPYCIKLRKIKEIQTDRGPEMCCPVCWVSNYEFAMRRYNPLAAIVEQHQPLRRTSGRRRRRK